jgi:hypothetical protein
MPRSALARSPPPPIASRPDLQRRAPPLGTPAGAPQPARAAPSVRPAPARADELDPWLRTLDPSAASFLASLDALLQAVGGAEHGTPPAAPRAPDRDATARTAPPAAARVGRGPAAPPAAAAALPRGLRDVETRAPPVQLEPPRPVSTREPVAGGLAWQAAPSPRAQGQARGSEAGPPLWELLRELEDSAAPPGTPAGPAAAVRPAAAPSSSLGPGADRLASSAAVAEPRTAAGSAGLRVPPPPLASPGPVAMPLPVTLASAAAAAATALPGAPAPPGVTPAGALPPPAALAAAPAAPASAPHDASGPAAVAGGAQTLPAGLMGEVQRLLAASAANSAKLAADALAARREAEEAADRYGPRAFTLCSTLC